MRSCSWVVQEDSAEDQQSVLSRAANDRSESMSMMGMERTISSINKGITDELEDQNNKYMHNEKVEEVEEEQTEDEINETATTTIKL